MSLINQVSILFGVLKKKVLDRTIKCVQYSDRFLCHRHAFHGLASHLGIRY